MSARALLGLAACLVCAAPAWADRSFDVGALRPAVDPYGLILTERAETPQRFELGAQLSLSYTHAPLSLRLATADGKGTIATDLVRGQIGIDLGLVLGVFDFLAVAVNLPLAAQFYDDAAVGEPIAIPRGGASPTPSTTGTGLYRGAPRENVPLAAAGPRDPRVTIKARLYQHPRFALAALASATVPIGNAASFLAERGVSFRPLLIADVRPLSRLWFAVNLGAVLRRYSELRDPVTGALLLTQSEDLLFAAAAAFRAHRLVGLSLEAYGVAPIGADVGASPPLPGEAEPPTHRSVHLDLLGSLYFFPTATLRVALSGGGDALPGSPLRDAGRALVQVAWSPSPRGGGL